MPSAVTVSDLVKSYGATQAVRGLGFSVEAGEVFGLLGPNGAGKTTTIECVIGLRRPDSGTVTVCGIDALTQAAEVKERIGVQLQATALQDQITVREALALFGSFYRKRAAVDELLQRFSLTEKADARFSTLSGGQRQRLAIVLALINQPEVVLLDEPTANLDPQSRRELHEVIRTMKAGGCTVLLTTHYIEEAETLCDRVAVVDHGTIIAQGTPRELIAGTRSQSRIVVTCARPCDPARLRALPGVGAVDGDGARATLTTAKVGDTIIALVKLLEAEHNELVDLAINKPSLEDVFIELTGRRLRD